MSKKKYLNRGPQRFYRVCVTGGIACGKSLAGAYLTKMGVPIMDADVVCHQLLRQDNPVGRRVVRTFGRDILGADGEIDRRVLAERVFENPSLLVKLNRLLPPPAQMEIKRWLRSKKNSACPMRVAVALVPLVYEAGWERFWDAIICVAAPLTLQMARLQQRGLSRAQARARVAAQMPLNEKMKRADFVIFNSGERKKVREQLEMIMQTITGGE